MLIEFRVSNFRSFREQQTLSMVAGSFPQHEETNTFDPNLKGFGRFLRAAAIYGPNASGKTNLLRALQFMKGLVLTSANALMSAQFPYTPFKFAAASRQAPSIFEITFAQDGIRYEYGFWLGPERIEREWLTQHEHTRGRLLFERIYDRKEEKYRWIFGSFLKGERTSWKNQTRKEALFLSTAVTLNSEQLLPIFDWFKSKLVVFVDSALHNTNMTLELLDAPDGKGKILPFLRESDLNISDLEVKKEPLQPTTFRFGPLLQNIPGKGMHAVTVSFYHPASDSEELISLDLNDESHGTKILFNTAGAWINVIANGEVLLFDELDSSLHTLLVKFLIQRFQSSINTKNAQLIFTTHNTSLLTQELFRRDQFWFVEKIRGGSSQLTPLSDFSPRNDEVLETWYMRGRYGAIPTLPEISSE